MPNVKFRWNDMLEIASVLVLEQSQKDAGYKNGERKVCLDVIGYSLLSVQVRTNIC
jgi:hypothetical protein